MDDVLPCRDVMDGGSGNDELYLVIEPRLIRPTLELDYSGLDPVAGSVTDPADAMADAVSIENFDLIGENQSHEDLEDELDGGISKNDFVDKLIIDKDHLMRRYALKADMDYDLNPRAVERAFNSAPTMGFTLGTTKDLVIKRERTKMWILALDRRTINAQLSLSLSSIALPLAWQRRFQGRFIH